MSDIEKKISLKGIDQVLADYNRLKTEVDELKNKSRELRQSTEDNSSNTMTELKGMAAQYLSVGAAIGLVTQAVMAHRDEQERVGRIYDEQNQKLVQQLALTSQLQSIKAIEAFTRTEGYEVDKARAAITGVIQGNPNIEFGQAQKLAGQLMQAQGVLSVDQVGQTAEITGRFDKMGFGDRSDDLALISQKIAGKEAGNINNRKFFSNIESMSAGGIDADTALAFNLAAISEDLGPKWAGQVVEQLLTTEKAKPGDSAIKRRFLRADEGSRLQMLQDPKVANEILGGKTAGEFAREFGKVDDIRGQLGGASDFENKMVAQAVTSNAGKEALEQSADKASADQEELARGGIADDWNAVRRVRSRLRSRQIARGGFSALEGFAEGLVDSAATEVGAFLGGDPRTSLQNQVNGLRSNGRSEEAEYLKEIARQNGIMLDLMQQQQSGAQAPSRSVHGE